jgi:hypothetical protein
LRGKKSENWLPKTVMAGKGANFLSGVCFVQQKDQVKTCKIEILTSNAL